MAPELDSRFRTLLHANSAGQTLRPASPSPATLAPSTPAVVRALLLHQSIARDMDMDEGKKENVTGKTIRCDTPTAHDTGHQHQTRSPAKMSTQTERRQSTPVKNFPLGPSALQFTSSLKNAQSRIADQPTSRPSGPGSRPSSPIKGSGSRPSSRPASPLKRTPAPGKNEHLETTPTGFRYTIELPESKIVPKKDSGATSSKSKASTPVKSFVLTESPSKTNSSKRASSRAKSASPRKELLKTCTTSPHKKGVRFVVNGAEPTPTVTTPTSNHRKRDSVELTKANGTHAGMPTVGVTKGDMWTGVQLHSPLTPDSGSIETKVNRNSPGDSERGPGMDSVSSSQVPMQHRDEQAVNEEKADVPSRNQSRRPSIATNFGEMLRNSNQDGLQTCASLKGEAQEKEQFADHTVLDKARRKSGIKTVSFFGVIAKPDLNGESPAEEAIAPVAKDFANGADAIPARESPQEPNIDEHQPSKHSRVSSSNIPQTSAGTPPALLAAIAADVIDIRISLRRSLGDEYMDTSRSPDLTHWLGSSTKCRTPPGLCHNADATNIVNTPRLNLNERMTAAKQSGPSNVPEMQIKKATPLLSAPRTNDRAEAQSPFRSRLPRASPTKPKAWLRTSGTILQAPRISYSDAPHATLLTPSHVPAMALRRAQYVPATNGESDTGGFASAEDIAKQVEEWNSTELKKKPTVGARTKLPCKTVTKPSTKPATTPRSKPTFMRPTATSAKKEKESYTPPGSPKKANLPFRSPRKTQLVPPQTISPTKKPSLPPRKPLSALKNPKVRAVAGIQTPLPTSKVEMAKAVDQGALRTPSREMVSKLDREIDAHLEREARSGRVFTPSGQRISDLLAAKQKNGAEAE